MYVGAETQIHYFMRLRKFGVTSDSAALAVIPISREPESIRFISLCCN
jgi:hypothetical protein